MVWTKQIRTEHICGTYRKQTKDTCMTSALHLYVLTRIIWLGCSEDMHFQLRCSSLCAKPTVPPPFSLQDLSWHKPCTRCRSHAAPSPQNHQPWSEVEAHTWEAGLRMAYTQVETSKSINIYIIKSQSQCTSWMGATWYNIGTTVPSQAPSTNHHYQFCLGQLTDKGEDQPSTVNLNLASEGHQKSESKQVREDAWSVTSQP